MPTEGLRSPEKQHEALPRPERLPEVSATQQEQETQYQEQPSVSSVTPSARPSVAEPQQYGDPAVQAVEAVLEDGLANAYAQLDEATQAVFKAEGERAASKIALLLQSTRVQVRKIVQIIVRWLRILPSVSSLFIEQEAKIKTDRLVNLTRHKSGGKQ